MVNKILDLEFAFARDQIFTSLRVALAQNVNNEIAKDQVPDKRRGAKIEAGVSIWIGLKRLVCKHVIICTAHSI